MELQNVCLFSDKMRMKPLTYGGRVTHKYISNYSISQEICTRFLLCCALLWLYIDWFSHTHQAYSSGNLTIAPVPAKRPWWIWINTSCEFIMNDCITTTKQSTTKPCAYFLGYTVDYALVAPDHGLLPYAHQAIIWTIAGLLLGWSLGKLRRNWNHNAMNFYTRKWFWKCCLQNGGHFVFASMCWTAMGQHYA